MPPKKNSTNRRRLADNERHTEWLELRRQGLNYNQISEQYGVSRQAVHKVIRGYMDNNIADGVEDLRESENQKLDTAEVAIWEQVKKGDLKAVDTFIRLSRRRADLNGLDQKISLNLNLSETNIKVEAVDYKQQLEALAPLTIEGSIQDVQSNTETETT